MNATLERPPLQETAQRLQRLFDEHLVPFYAQLSAEGLLISNPAPHLLTTALRDLGEVYSGPKSVHFGRLEDGARFSFHGEKFVKLTSDRALHCMSGQTRDFSGTVDVVYDASEDHA